MKKNIESLTGKTIKAYHGLGEILGIKESEPDGYGGFLYDIHVKWDNGEYETMVNIDENLLCALIVEAPVCG